LTTGEAQASPCAEVERCRINVAPHAPRHGGAEATADRRELFTLRADPQKGGLELADSMGVSA